MADPSLRLATSVDVESVLALWALADAIPSVTDDSASVGRAIELGCLLVAEVDGQIVGSLIAGFDGWRGAMYRLAVDPAYRRRGIARELVGAGERHLLEQGCRRISALVVRDEDHATAFWRSVGCDLDERIERYVKTARP